MSSGYNYSQPYFTTQYTQSAPTATYSSNPTTSLGYSFPNATQGGYGATTTGTYSDPTQQYYAQVAAQTQAAQAAAAYGGQQQSTGFYPPAPSADVYNPQTPPSSEQSAATDTLPTNLPDTTSASKPSVWPKILGGVVVLGLLWGAYAFGKKGVGNVSKALEATQAAARKFITEVQGLVTEKKTASGDVTHIEAAQAELEAVLHNPHAPTPPVPSTIATPPPVNSGGTNP